MENIIGHWLLNSPEGRKIIKKSKNVSDLKNNVNEYIIKNDIIATPMGSVKDIKTVKDWEHIYKNTKFSYKDGGSTSLGVVTIKFDNPKYNYTTNVSSSTTEAEARRYFVGKMLDVGSYPKENMQRVIDIDFSKSSDKMRTGGGILGDNNHWKNMPKDAAKDLAEYYGNKKLAFNKKELNLNKKDLAELKEVQMMINKYHPEFNHYLSLMHKENKMENGGSTKGFNYSIGGL